MSENIKELVKRLRDGFITMECEDDVVRYTNHVAADALEAMAGEVASLKLSNDLFQGAQKKEAEMNTQLTIQLHAIRTERDRLKAALETIAYDNVPREVFIVWRTDGSNSKHDKCQHMRVMYDDCGNCTALFARKALGDAS